LIEFQVLGGLRIAAPGLSAESRIHRRHPLGLLALVAAAAPRPLARERAMALLWPESDAGRASNSLRQTLFWLRRDLGEDLFLPDAGGALQLNPARIRVDLQEFRAALSRGAHEEAVGCYGGPFLDGFHFPGAAEFGHLVDAERARLAREFADALDALGRLAEDEGRPDDAVAWRRRQAAADPYSSRVALALLDALSRSGDRAGALEYAAVYEKLVRLHLEIEPDPAVLARVAELRAGKGTPPAPLRARTPSPTPAPAAAADGAQPIRIRSSRHGRWVAAGLVVVVAAAAGFRILTGSSAPGGPPTIVLATGATHHAGRDAAIRMVSCEGPACPGDALPAAPFVIPPHRLYTPPAAGTNYIAPVPDGSTVEPPGYECCTTAVFEHPFELPPEATSAQIVIRIRADNAASMAINGVEFVSQEYGPTAWNFSGTPTPHTVSFVPGPGGRNVLRVTLRSFADAIGLYYHAVVTYELPAQQP